MLICTSCKHEGVRNQCHMRLVGGGLVVLTAKKATTVSLCGKTQTAVLKHPNTHSYTYSTYLKQDEVRTQEATQKLKEI